jgi:hypothetical protein
MNTIAAVAWLEMELMGAPAHAAQETPPAPTGKGRTYDIAAAEDHQDINRRLERRHAMIYGEGGTTCSYVRDEGSRSERWRSFRQLHKEGSKTFDTLIWISQSSGVPLRQKHDAEFGKGQTGNESLPTQQVTGQAYQARQGD